MTTNRILLFIHCKKCLDEIRSGISGKTSPRDYARNEVGLTEDGIQVWCVRHEMEVFNSASDNFNDIPEADEEWFAKAKLGNPSDANST